MRPIFKSKAITVICSVFAASVFSSGVGAQENAPAASDWPMWRCNAGRTAITASELPVQLHLRWVRKLPAPLTAWPASQTKLQFDAAYEPVVMGKQMFVSSMVRDSVTAYDTDSGREMWRFYTNGPVRFAPVASAGKVYFVSDDGYLYCVSAANGKKLWRFRGGPEDRTVLGNDRLISLWPARGAPVLYDGNIYFAAGIWPFMGIFIHAVDAESGKVVWTNSGSGSIYINQQHGSPAFAGVAPQGYIAATADKLLISGGRTVPAVHDRMTGRFLYFHVAERKLGHNAGDYGVTAVGKRFFNGRGVYDLETGAALLRLEGLATAQGMFCLEKGKLSFATPAPVEKDNAKGKRITVWMPNRRLLGELSPASTKIFLKAGKRLYCGAPDGTVLGVDVGNGDTATVSWRTRIEGMPWNMLAADGKLFVTTRQGQIYCFSGDEGEPKTLSEQTRLLSRADDQWAGTARRVLAQAGGGAGYCIVLGGSSGRLITELLGQSRFNILVVERDEKRVRALRERFYGLPAPHSSEASLRRISVLHGDPLGFPFPPLLANLVVSEDSSAGARTPNQADVRRIFEWLRPYGGVACLPRASLAIPELENAQISRDDRFVTIRRTGPLPGSAPWTHQSADSANTVVSRDERVRAPLGLLWFGGPSNAPILPRHGHGPSPQVAGGRLFIEGRHMLRAVDVYTGRLVWEETIRDLGEYYDRTDHFAGAGAIGSNYVSMPDGVYVKTPRSCLRIDPATGATVKEFALSAEEGAENSRWGFIMVWDDLLIAATSPIHVPLAKGPIGQEPHPLQGDLSQAVGMKPIIKKNAQWQYLAGAHPKETWMQPDFAPAEWRTGKAGFGYGDNDDATVLSDMYKRYTAVYIRKQFRIDDPKAVHALALVVRYDDAFIAYLNGKEILRVGVGKGSGAAAADIHGHEAGGYALFDIKAPTKLLRAGVNVLAIEGHNISLNSSDFTLDPYLVVAQAEGKSDERSVMALKDVPGVVSNSDNASTSRTLVVLDRNSGKVLWHRDAKYGFRHNAIAVAKGKIFCIDKLSEKQLAYLRRRGYSPKADATLYALDARSGEILWETNEKVFGTWLGYSEEHDVLLQAGSAARDRAQDEAAGKMIAYRGSDGTVLWQSERNYAGPCLLHHNTIITQRHALDLLTGEPREREHPLTGRRVPWSFMRNYGCNTVIGSEHLLTFRSAAAGFYDLAGNGGTGNLGGFKSGCTSNLIVADGVLNAPDYTRTCTCSYQNQTSLAFIHNPDVEVWTFSTLAWSGERIRRVGINFGAPGDRLDANGTLWLDHPSVGGPSPKVPVVVEGGALSNFRHHASLLKSETLPWVVASGVAGLERVRITVAGKEQEAQPYTVRLFFAEPNRATVAGDRVFDIYVQGKLLPRDFDIAKEAGGARRMAVAEFDGISIAGELEIAFRAKVGQPVLCGVELVMAGN